jgi:hypothetical protein
MKTVKEEDIHKRIIWKTKSERFLAQLLRGHRVSSAQAYEVFGLFRPAVPIQRFRELGYKIQTEILERTNYRGEVVRYGVYFMKPEDMEHNLKIAKNLGL